MDIMHLLDRLEELIGEGFGVPGTGKVLVDRQRLFDLFDELRAAIPEDVHEAEEVLEQRDQLLEDARAAAKRLRDEADAIYRQKLDEHDLVRAAREEAEKIVEQGRQRGEQVLAKAEAEANDRLHQVNDYTLTQLRRLETALSTQMNTIQQAITDLSAAERTATTRPSPTPER